MSIKKEDFNSLG